MSFFDSQTFKDHANHPSIGRRMIFWVGIAMALLLVCAMICIAFLVPLDRAKLMSSFALGALGIGAGLITGSYASAQYSKGKAHQGQEPTPPPGAPTTPPTPAEVPKPPEQTANKGA
jgi:hypothetical protein